VTRAEDLVAAEQLPPTEQQTIADLIRRLVNDLQDLIDRQIELAKQELRENLIQLAKASGLLAAGALLLFLAVLFLLITIILGVEAIWQGRGWIAALTITLLLGIVGAGLALRGKDRVKIDPVSRTRETLKEDFEWVQRLRTRNGK
jgi:uncharacterized membrane protein YqjE